LETFNVDFIVEAAVTSNVESNVAAFLRYNSPFNDASPDTFSSPLREISSVIIN
jgi:hypothetical protein